MKVRQFSIRKLLGAGFAFLLSFNCFGFALMGPYEDWMQYSNGFKFPGDIGGPMELHSEYRWNVPVITYGFDQSFMDFFGAEGKAAVEDAIQIFNDLPTASQIVLTNYSTETRRLNGPVYAQGVYDLKSETMHLLLKRIGLGSPVRSIFVLRHFDPIVYPYSPWQFSPFGWDPDWDELYEPNYPRRNYDPDTLAPNFIVNERWFSGVVQVMGPGMLDFSEIPVDPSYLSFSAVAEDRIFSDSMEGTFYTGFTRDDVGGLKYLLNSSNVNYEFLSPGVHGWGTNAVSWTDGAWRPGVEKITLVSQSYDAVRAAWIPVTNRYTDAYVTNGAIAQQQLERIVTQPDILFSAANNGEGNSLSVYVAQTDTSGWQNNALNNGNTNGAGPGVISSPARIVFHKMVTYCGSAAAGNFVSFSTQRWGKIDSTNASPILFPVGSYSGRNELVVNLKLIRNATYLSLKTWHLPYPVGGVAVLERSTNFTSWTPMTAFTNEGGVVDWYHFASGQQEFFRIQPQQ